MNSKSPNNHRQMLEDYSLDVLLKIQRGLEGVAVNGQSHHEKKWAKARLAVVREVIEEKEHLEDMRLQQGEEVAS